MTVLLAALVRIVPVAADSDDSRIFLDGTAARVNASVILESDIRIEIALMRQLAAAEGRPMPSPERDIILNGLVERELLLVEARKFITRTVTGEEIAGIRAELDRRYGGPEQRQAVLESLHLDATFWDQRMRNQILIDKYIDQRVAQFIRITGRDEDRYINAHAVELGLDAAEDPAAAVPEDHALRRIVNELLKQQAINARRTELIQELRASAQIDIIPGHAGAADPPESAGGQ
ncbi:MAG TPA: hypothetical protein PLV45_14340 [bacterium]|mgnify:CR=1 FL=1|nr:hypothetical protein [bacterium]